MPAERLSMREVREVLRLKHALDMSYQQISEATELAKRRQPSTCGGLRRLGSGGPSQRGSTIQSSSGDCSRSPRTVQISALRATGPRSKATEPAWRDIGTAVGGVSRRASKRLQLHAVLRAI